MSQSSSSKPNNYESSIGTVRSEFFLQTRHQSQRSTECKSPPISLATCQVPQCGLSNDSPFERSISQPPFFHLLSWFLFPYLFFCIPLQNPPLHKWLLVNIFTPFMISPLQNAREQDQQDGSQILGSLVMCQERLQYQGSLTCYDQMTEPSHKSVMYFLLFHLFTSAVSAS